MYKDTNNIEDKLLIYNLYDCGYINKYTYRFEKKREILFNLFLNHYNIDLNKYDYRQIWKVDNLIVLDALYPRVYPKLYGEYIQWLTEEYHRTNTKTITSMCRSCLSLNLTISNKEVCVFDLETSLQDLEDYIINMKYLFIEDLAIQIRTLIGNINLEYFNANLQVNNLDNYEIVKCFYKEFYKIDIEQQYRKQDVMLLDIDIKRELNKIGVYDFYSLDI